MLVELLAELREFFRRYWKAILIWLFFVFLLPWLVFMLVIYAGL